MAVPGDVFIQSQDLFALLFSKHVLTHKFLLIGFIQGKAQLIISSSENSDFFFILFDVAETLSDMAFNFYNILVAWKDGLELFLDLKILHFALFKLNLEVAQLFDFIY